MTYWNFRCRAGKTALPKILGSAVMAFALSLGAWPAAWAQAVCLPRGEMAKQLDDRFSETPIAIALAGNGGLLEVFSTANGSTWTIIVTRPDGTSCVLATGEAWAERKRAVQGPTV